MNSTPPVFVRRLGKPEALSCVSLDRCPEVLELADGSFAFIGRDITAEAESHFPPGVGCGSGERIVVLPRDLIVRAKRELPDA